MKIKWNRGAFRELRFDPNVVVDIDARARRIAEACGDGFEAGSYAGRSRHRGSVITATPQAMRHDRKHNTLLRNLDAGR